VCETKGKEGAMVDVDLAFNELDKKGDGKITEEAFVLVMKERLPHLIKYDWEKYFSYVDTSHANFIDYNHFKTAALDRAFLLSEQNLDIVFNVLNKKKDGLLSPEELQAAIEGNFRHETPMGGDQTILGDKAKKRASSIKENKAWKQLKTETTMKATKDGGLSKRDFFELMKRVEGHRPTHFVAPDSARGKERMRR
jgi:Ca2+-binding EF-hand superfamily protein